MKSLLQYTHPIKKEDLDYLEKFTVGIVGSRLLAEIAWRIGIGCVKYIGDFISTSDVFTDVTIDIAEVGNFDVLCPKGKTLIVSHVFERSNDLIKMLRGCDVIISHRYVKLSAKAAERFGVPFMPPVVTTVLPDELNDYLNTLETFEDLKFNPATYSLLCSAQTLELINLCTSGNVVLAPEAYLPVNGTPYFKKVDIKDVR